MNVLYCSVRVTFYYPIRNRSRINDVSTRDTVNILMQCFKN